MAVGHDPDLEGLGRFVRERRGSLNLTQTQLAERLDWVQERISLIENGRYGLPSLPALVRLAEALECPLASVVEAVGYRGLVAEPSQNGARPGNVALQYALQQLLTIEATTLKAALDAASDVLGQAMGADKVDAFIYDPSSATLVSLGASNTPMSRRQFELGLDRMPLANRGRLVEAYETGGRFRTGRADEDPHMPIGIVEALGVRSCVAVPLRVDRQLRGLMVANSAHPDRFSHEELQFFDAATRWAGMVAQRAELTESLTRTAAEEARRLAAEELVTVLAHDLGNALTPITGRIQMMQRRYTREGRERDADEARDVARGVAHVQQMVTELLDVARLDQGIFALSRQPVDHVSILEDVVQEMKSTRPSIEVRAPHELCVQADPGRLGQALENLVSNAMHHTPDGTPIILGVGTERREDREWAVLSVHDEGPGIPADLLSGLFDRFSSGPQSTGLGLGLYLARSIAEAHGGTLTASSVPGKGTTFWLSLPLSDGGR
jgi:two-component system OmpR family sensor kinase